MITVIAFSIRCLIPSLCDTGVDTAPWEYYNPYSAENDLTFVITSKTTDLELSEWLENNKPSKIGSRFRQTVWINLYWENGVVKDEAKEAHAKQLWQEDKRKEITYDSVIEIAKKTGYLEGKWVIHPHKDNSDKNWKAVAMGILNKKFGEDILQATVDCQRSNIRVYTKDITRRDEIFYCEEVLRKVGVSSLMHYRPSIFSLLKIRNDIINETHLYQSRYPEEMEGNKVIQIRSKF